VPISVWRGGTMPTVAVLVGCLLSSLCQIGRCDPKWGLSTFSSAAADYIVVIFVVTNSRHV